MAATASATASAIDAKSGIYEYYDIHGNITHTGGRPVGSPGRMASDDLIFQAGEWWLGKLETPKGAAAPPRLSYQEVAAGWRPSLSAQPPLSDDEKALFHETLRYAVKAVLAGRVFCDLRSDYQPEDALYLAANALGFDFMTRFPFRTYSHICVQIEGDNWYEIFSPSRPVSMGVTPLIKRLRVRHIPPIAAVTVTATTAAPKAVFPAVTNAVSPAVTNAVTATAVTNDAKEILKEVKETDTKETPDIKSDTKSVKSKKSNKTNKTKVGFKRKATTIYVANDKDSKDSDDKDPLEEEGRIVASRKIQTRSKAALENKEADRIKQEKANQVVLVVMGPRRGLAGDLAHWTYEKSTSINSILTRAKTQIYCGAEVAYLNDADLALDSSLTVGDAKLKDGDVLHVRYAPRLCALAFL